MILGCRCPESCDRWGEIARHCPHGAPGPDPYMPKVKIIYDSPPPVDTAPRLMPKAKPKLQPWLEAANRPENSIHCWAMYRIVEPFTVTMHSFKLDRGEMPPEWRIYIKTAYSGERFVDGQPPEISITDIDPGSSFKLTLRAINANGDPVSLQAPFPDDKMPLAENHISSKFSLQRSGFAVRVFGMNATYYSQALLPVYWRITTKDDNGISLWSNDTKAASFVVDGFVPLKAYRFTVRAMDKDRKFISKESGEMSYTAPRAADYIPAVISAELSGPTSVRVYNMGTKSVDRAVIQKPAMFRIYAYWNDPFDGLVSRSHDTADASYTLRNLLPDTQYSIFAIALDRSSDEMSRKSDAVILKTPPA